MGCFGLKTVSTTKKKDDDEECDEEEIPDYVGNIRGFRFDCFRRLLLRSDDNWGYHRDLHGDYSYYDRDWRDDSYYRWHDYRDRDDRSSWNRIDP